MMLSLSSWSQSCSLITWFLSICLISCFISSVSWFRWPVPSRNASSLWLWKPLHWPGLCLSITRTIIHRQVTPTGIALSTTLNLQSDLKVVVIFVEPEDDVVDCDLALPPCLHTIYSRFFTSPGFFLYEPLTTSNPKLNAMSFAASPAASRVSYRTPFSKNYCNPSLPLQHHHFPIAQYRPHHFPTHSIPNSIGSYNNMSDNF